MSQAVACGLWVSMALTGFALSSPMPPDMLGGATSGKVTVLDYGADPTGAKDSTAAFRAALRAEGAVLVNVPGGTYTITASLSITGQTLEGSRHGAWGSDQNCADLDGISSCQPLPTIRVYPFGLSGSNRHAASAS